MPDHSVLIIEDRPDIADSLCAAVMATDGIEVAAVAGDLDRGLQLLFEVRPRVLLVDIGLPDGSGVDAIRAVSQVDWQVDALVISIFGDEARVIEAIRAGAKGYVLKGGDLAHIGEDIHSVLDGGSPISPAIARHLLAVLNDPRDSPTPEGASTLTNRETEILRAVARGYKRHEIAAQLGISAGTVGNHITSIYRKLEVSSNIEAVAIASRAGML
ncbi:LuxR C-terminal-related transcriptional regulator [Gymnodinialimonas sp.]